MYVDAQTIITGGAIVGALTAIITLFWKLFKWIDHQKAQDKEIEKIKSEMDEHKAEFKRAQADILEEQTLITYGLLACLKGLAEQGCDGPVKDAINRIERHINMKAHAND